MRYLVLEGELAEHVKAKPGDYVYRSRGYDYGLASDDTLATGVEHISVTLNKFGGYPSFTIPVHMLGECEQDIPVYPDDDHARDVCLVGRGAITCRYLTMGKGGWSCEKHSSLGLTLAVKANKNEMIAQGDNCEGMYSR